jgi:4-hydroxymandelate oxidase
MKVDRRESLRKFGAFLADSPLAQAEPAGSSLAQGEPGGGAPPSDRLAPVLELLNVPEFEAMARLVLPPARFEEIGGGHRTSFDRMTFRQRLMVYAMDLDLTTRLFGYDMFAPIIVGPVANQGDIHPDGELATARGASAGKAVMVATRQSSQPIDQVVAASDEPVWYQLYADSGALRDDAAQAVDAGCRAVCLTVGVSSDHRPTATDWDAVAALARAVDVPVVVKGVMGVESAETALDRGAQGLVVSSHGLGGALPVDVLPAVADAVAGRVPVLVDGSFRRGTDVLKGLALGAAAVLVARPPMWGLAAYGSEGVQTVVEILQTELARNMAAAGRPRIDMIDRELVRFDSR